MKFISSKTRNFIKATLTGIILLSTCACDTLSIYQEDKSFDEKKISQLSQDHSFVKREISKNLMLETNVRRFNYKIGALVKLKNSSTKTYLLKPSEFTMHSIPNNITLKYLGYMKCNSNEKIADEITLNPREEVCLNIGWDGTSIMGSSHIVDKSEQHRLKLTIKGIFISNKQLPSISIDFRDK